jgi:CheY-like chemotaxis protein
MMGHEADYAMSGHEGLALAETFKPDVAFLDMLLPDMTGYEIARQLKENSRTEKILLAAITGMPPNNEKIQKELGWFDAFFLKPISVKEIEKWALDSLNNTGQS